MSDLNRIERKKLERLFGMGNGYVLNFSNKTFEEFVLESIKVAAYDGKYDKYGSSKANRLRVIWEKESNYGIGKLLGDLLEYRKTEIQLGAYGIEEVTEDLIQDCLKIIDRLKQESPVENLEALAPINDDRDFALVAKQIRESIEKNEPEAALDRLHTFCVKFFRELNDKHGNKFTRDTPLQNLMGSYVKAILTTGKIESVMTERILKTSISVLDTFNKIRNDHSLAHDNPILNYHESLLIFNNIANTIKFIQFIEANILEEKKEEPESFSWDSEDLPF
jgi:hypothetical protein